MIKKIILWLPLAFTITCLSGLIYLLIQQDVRLSANEPQIQMSEDIASSLVLGGDPRTLNNVAKVDISKSLSPFIIIFDSQGQLLGSSVELDSKTPTVPSGVFEKAKKTGQNRLTWQPKNNVRSAIVITKYDGKNPGFVLVGKSLREVEKLEDQLLLLTGLGWLVTLAGSLTIFYLVNSLKGKKS